MSTTWRLSLISLLLLLGLLALFGGLWVWSGSATSLAGALAQVTHLLPASQTLEVRDVSGSLRSGGQIGWLRWQQGGLSVEARDVQIDWSVDALLDQQLQINQLAVGHLRIEDQRVSAVDELPVPLAELSLPLKVNASVSVDAVEWVGSSSQRFDKLAFNYIFDSYSHRLDKGYIHILSNKYEFSGELQAHGPMALLFKADGVVNVPVSASQPPLKVTALARLDGQLAGADARLALHATLTPQSGSALAGKGGTPVTALQATLSAQLAPWQMQKIISAQGQWQALDLASLWPQTPKTLLSGAASVSPQGQGWQASIHLDNSQSGPLDQQRLPLQSLRAELNYSNGQWLVQSLQAGMAGGSVVAKGQFRAGASPGEPERWNVLAEVSGINAAGLYSPLSGVLIGGTLGAEQTPKGIGFDVNLQASRNKATAGAAPAATQKPATLRLQSLLAQGLWAAPMLTLTTLRLEAEDANLQGQLAYDSSSHASRGQLSLKLPGLTGTLDGHLASADGQGQLALELQDLAQTSRWLARWPQIAGLFKGYQLQGNARLSARWQGGWQNDAQALQIEARLRAPQLDWTGSASAPGEAASAARARNLQLDITGTPGSFSLSSLGLLQASEQQIDWQAQVQGGRVKSGAWQASLKQLQLSLRQGAASVPWRLQLDQASGSQPVTLNWQATELANTLTVSGGAARLQGPAAGSASLNWQPLRWTQTSGAGPSALQPKPAQWQSQGRIDGVPLAWLDAISHKTLADLGISGDLLLSGRWEAGQTDRLHLSVLLERSQGDLNIQADASRPQVLPAGITEARLQLNLDDKKVSGNLRWDSERFGRALLAFSTELQQQGWALAPNAALGGSLQMRLPPVDAWSALAPPGWRLRGTMDANVSLSGTLDAPHWAGSLQARDLALRSVVDGIDFSKGTLLAKLNGQQLDIETFTLQGAGGAAGGQIDITGAVFWRTGDIGAAAKRLGLKLEARAKELRLSSRPDRRITVSGRLTAELKDTHLSLRGALKADQALLTLPDDDTPQLGSDVVVRGAAASAKKPGALASSPVTGGTGTRPADSNRISPDLLVELDLGPDFQVRGRGVVTRLAGKLSLAAKDVSAPSLTGTVRTVDGSYRAYGQTLEIERGLLRFTGALDNPSLAVLAIRPKLSQRVGVQISGTALSPIVQLYADPDMPEADKLGWLVLGRAPSGDGAQAALLQQAALALLGRNAAGLTDGLTRALGLDEMSFSGSSSIDNADGSTSTASVTLGKRLSKDFYVAYESSLNGAMGVIHIFYDLTKHLTLRAETGQQSAIDLIYTLSYD
ncbi:MAG TPA: translocation/assembly module TamB domain-containing protein [Rhodoferax sp.]|nr:translocation/assembly module TamB domain-containing protein [Rhodoferax sp.]